MGEPDPRNPEIRTPGFGSEVRRMGGRRGRRDDDDDDDNNNDNNNNNSSSNNNGDENAENNNNSNGDSKTQTPAKHNFDNVYISKKDLRLTVNDIQQQTYAAITPSGLHVIPSHHRSHVATFDPATLSLVSVSPLPELIEKKVRNAQF